MIQAKDNEMGRFSVSVDLANNRDIELADAGQLPPSQIRRLTLRGVVDTGATTWLIPESVAQQLQNPGRKTIAKKK